MTPAESEPRTSVREALLNLPHTTRDDVRAATGWILPDEGSWQGLSQLGVQIFVWYSLPVKWFTDVDHHVAIAEALAELFDVAGFSRYAAICRAPETTGLIRLWDTDRARARRQYLRLTASSGVAPADTELLAWGSLQGPVEHAASWIVSEALEDAVATGRFVPGRRGWRTTAAAVIDETLLGPAPGDQATDGPAPSLLSVVLDERRSHWLDRLGRSSPHLRTLAEPLLLASSPAPPTASAGSDAAPVPRPLEDPEALRWLLDTVGDGVRLTAAGYLPKPMALAADARFHWFDLSPRFTARGERDLPQLLHLRELARTSGLLTQRSGRLTVSAKGRAALDRPGRLAEVALGHLLDRETFGGDAGIHVAAALLVHARSEVPLQTLFLAVEELTNRWSVQGDPPNETELRVVTYDVVRTLGMLGWASRSGLILDDTVALTDAGRAALWHGIRSSAEGPARNPF